MMLDKSRADASSHRLSERSRSRVIENFDAQAASTHAWWLSNVSEHNSQETLDPQPRMGLTSPPEAMRTPKRRRPP